MLFNDTLNPSDVARTVKRERVSVVVTVPRLLESLKQKVERDADPEKAESLCGKICSAPPSEQFPKRWWRFRNWPGLLDGSSGPSYAEAPRSTPIRKNSGGAWDTSSFKAIGLTETTSLISVQHPFKMGKRSIGKALPGREIKLDPQSGRSWCAAKAFRPATGRAKSKSRWRGRRLVPHRRSGRLDAEGNLYFKGRSKDVIVNAEGLKIYPEGPLELR